MATCLYCTVALADLGRYCSGCYGREFHADGSALVLGDPSDPWGEFNAEADRTIADQKLHAILAPRMAARWFFPVKVAAWKLRAKNPTTQTRINKKELRHDRLESPNALPTAPDPGAAERPENPAGRGDGQ